MIVSSDKVKTFALKKDNYVSVSIDMPKVVTSSPKQMAEEPVVENKIIPEKAKDVNIDNLFSDVWTKSIQKPKEQEKKINNRLLQEIQKKINTSENNSVESLSKKVKSIDKAKVDDQNSKTSTADEVNEYLAKIQALVYEHFYPPSNSEGNSVKAVIELSSIGKLLDFRILTYSSNSSLNSECDKIKGRIINLIFPVNPNNSSGKYTITLTSEE
jgi:protein TonB